MAGRDEDYRGEAQLGINRTVGILEQEPNLDPSKDVKGNVEDGVAETKALLDRFNELSMNYSDETADEFAKLQEQIDAADAWNLDTQLEYAMDALRLPPADAEVTNLSGGERRRVALCRLLLRQPDMLLLERADQPPRRRLVAWLERYSPSTRAPSWRSPTIGYFLDNVAAGSSSSTRQGHPVRGQLLDLAARPRPSACSSRTARTRRAERVPLGRARVGAHEPQGRRTKVQGALARYEEMVNAEQQVQLDQVQIHIPPARAWARRHQGDGLRKGFDDGCSSRTSLRPAARGHRRRSSAPTARARRRSSDDHRPGAARRRLARGRRLRRAGLRRPVARRPGPEKTVWEEISEGYDQIKVGDKEMNSRQYVGGFNFKKSDQQKRVGTLSGGERNRVHLAKVLRKGGNVLLLDEPTNDLDVDTLRALESALLDFAGCAVVISHDRWFLDRICTHVLAFEGESQVTWFEGNFEAYEEHRRERLGAEADRPHRITYKRLVRT
jgi:ABC-type lipoprotein export system ATPase subunit